MEYVTEKIAVVFYSKATEERTKLKSHAVKGCMVIYNTSSFINLKSVIIIAS